MNLNTKGRLAGILYLLLVITGIFNLKYVPTELIVWSLAGRSCITTMVGRRAGSRGGKCKRLDNRHRHNYYTDSMEIRMVAILYSVC